MFPIISDPKRKIKIQEYINYLDKVRRNTTKSRYEVHNTVISRATAKSYGLTEKEIKLLDDILKKEENNYVH